MSQLLGPDGHALTSTPEDRRTPREQAFELAYSLVVESMKLLSETTPDSTDYRATIEKFTTRLHAFFEATQRLIEDRNDQLVLMGRKLNEAAAMIKRLSR